MWREENTIQEIEFVAESTYIEIIPNFKKEELKLLCVIIIFI
jgi:hypothetical protein